LAKQWKATFFAASNAYTEISIFVELSLEVSQVKKIVRTIFSMLVFGVFD
jgi:hypothetical protein